MANHRIITISERLVIREFTNADAVAMRNVFCDPDVMRSSDVGPQDHAFVDQWINEQVAFYETVKAQGYWAVSKKHDGNVIGYACLTKRPDRAGSDELELGYRLARSAWGQGYATEAADALLRYGFNLPDINSIIAIIEPSNTASVRVAEKLGMTFVREAMFEGYDHPDHVYQLTP